MTGDGRWRPGARTHYDVLDVPFDADPDVIRRAYRAAAVQVHPDRNAGDQDEATARMSQLNAAWAVLGDPDAKRAYDRDLFGEFDPFDTGDDRGDSEQMIHSPRFRVSVAVILLVVLLVIFVFTAYAGAPTRP